MTSKLLVMEAANLFCGDHDPTASKHLTLSELQLPMLQEMFADHHAGGSRVKIEIPVGIEKLEPTFKLVGWDGSLRDKKTGVAIGSKAIIEGRLGKIEQEAFKRGELQSHDYAINGVTHYELHVDGVEKVFWDFYTTQWRIDGRPQNDDERRLLNLPI
jgi:uncharacterized protein